MTQSPPPTTYLAQPTMNPADEKMWSILTHVGGIFFYWLVPLVAFLVLKDRGPFVRWHTRQALNFHITLVIAYVAGVVLSLVLVGYLVLLAAGILQITFGILAALAANRGEFYRIPVAIEFVT
jgi:uncharacterized Tic20 family protein